MNLYVSNEIIARSLEHHEKTIALLTDERPGFQREYAIETGRWLQEQGYWVYEISVNEFMEKNLALIGAMLLLPHAESVPAKMAQALKHYWLQGGQILVLGGPLFRDLIEEEEGSYVKKELPNTVLDAHHSGKTGEITIEGLVPSHKVYLESAVKQFMTEEVQYVTNAELETEEEQSLVCPVPRPYGIGYGMEHRNRFIPLVEAMGEGGRAEGRRGAGAFIMLSDSRGHLRFTNGSRPGTVTSTVMGSAIGCIGLRRQDLLRIGGCRKLIGDMVKALFRGLYLYEAGAEQFVYEPGNTCRVGARILNTTQDFQQVEVEFTLWKGNLRVAEERQSCLAMPWTYTNCRLEWQLPGCGSYYLITRLLYQEEIIDEVTQELNVDMPRKAGRERCVQVKGRDFILDGKQWNILGMNYWPLYYPSIDREDYWMGWLDKSNYDPIEVERDLALMEDMGINCIFTRLDGNVFERSIPQLKDFMVRLERHHMKLSLSYANATNPLNYCGAAFRKLMDDAGLHGNPVLFGHDISWEIGHQYFSAFYLPRWTTRWTEWIGERYGSIEKAEQDWGVPIDRSADGAVITPPREQLESDGPWRVKICAFRRFMDNMLSRIWNDAVSDMRKVDPCHIIGYRMGCFNKNGGGALTSTNKHTDYSSLEGYSFMENEDGRFASQCVTKVSQMLTGDKPVIWVEFGSNLIGTSGNSPWSALKWDREKLRPPREKYEEQTAYYEQFFRMFRACDIAGSAPWWYAGGFRRVECSDCGFVEPNGTLRPVAEAYVSLGREWLLKERKHRKPERWVSYDPDVHSAGWGKFYLGSGSVDRGEYNRAVAEGREVLDSSEYGAGVQACREAEEQGLELAVTTPGFGTTSVDTPLVAVGNVPYNGHNPLKYLDSEFNKVLLHLGTDETVLVKNGDTVFVPADTEVWLEAEMGNLREAAWIAGDREQAGAVCLAAETGDKKSLFPILQDTPYLHDAKVGVQLLFSKVEKDCEVSLRMEAVGRGSFGERLKMLIIRR